MGRINWIVRIFVTVLFAVEHHLSSFFYAHLIPKSISIAEVVDNSDTA